MNSDIRNIGQSSSILQLSPAWEATLDRAKIKRDEAASAAARFLPKDRSLFLNRVRFVNDRNSARGMADFLEQRRIVLVGMDTEFRYSEEGVHTWTASGRDVEWCDPRSVEPLMLTLAAVELRESSDTEYDVYRFAVDLRQSAVLDSVQHVLRMPVPFIGHFLQAELICLWKLGLAEPNELWDTWAAEKAIQLGCTMGTLDRKNQATEGDDKDLCETYGPMSLLGTCDRYGIRYPFAGVKTELQASFLNMDENAEFSPDQIEYAVADAVAAAGLYLPQVRRTAKCGLLRHLQSIEMSWAVTNARMHWNGVRVAPQRIEQLREACQRHVAELGAQLADEGLHKVNSFPQMKALMERHGLLELFRSGDSYSFDDKHLETYEDRHPSIRKVRLVRKVQRLLSDQLLNGSLIGKDGRLHPEHRQLQAASGRNSMRHPNIGGIGQALRPLVVPDEGYGIGEVDLVQIEIGIAAAVYNDPDLIRMFNGRDVYVAMAKRFYETDRNGSTAGLSDSEFKKKHSELRAKMKVFTLGIIYGMSPHGIALQLGITHKEAMQEHERFMSMFPTLNDALLEAAALGAIRGYADTNTGLKRHRQRTGRTTTKERNWLVNTPVQGSAANVFKDAGNRLDKRLQHYEARLIMPLHDSFIFEAPLGKLSQVSKVVAEVMRSTVQEHFPKLAPRTDINIEHPSCWNKDGTLRSLRLWMANPELARL